RRGRARRHRADRTGADRRVIPRRQARLAGGDRRHADGGRRARHRARLAVADAALIGVDLGPNLSITGSLATILWLLAIRRGGEHVDFWRFLKVGAIVMPPALVLAI